jgi:hypothetical protein
LAQVSTLGEIRILAIVMGFVELDLRPQGPGVELDGAGLGVLRGGRELGNHGGGQDGHDHHDNQHLNQGESTTATIGVHHQLFLTEAR